MSWRVGIAGAGYIAGAHLRALRAIENVKVVAVCDARRDRAESLARTWGIPSAYGSIAEMVAANKPDAVHVITPPEAHLGPALECIAAGCHVFCEKPLAPRSADCAEMEQAAARAGVQAGVNHNQSWHPAILTLERFARECRFGRIEHVAVNLSTGLRQLNAGQHGHWMFQAPGNILLEQAPHPLSQVMRLIGPVTDASCSASGRRVLNTGAVFHDTWQCALQCERGRAQMLLAFGRDDLDSWIHVTGQDASAHVDLRRNTVTFHEKRRWAPALADLLDGCANACSLAAQSGEAFAAYALGFLKLRPSQDPFEIGMRGSIGAFYAALTEGREVPVSFRHGRQVVETCELLLARSGL